MAAQGRLCALGPANFKAIEGLITQYSLPWDLNGMNLAYSVAKEAGLIEASVGTQGSRQRVSDEDLEADTQFVSAPRVGRRRTAQGSGW